MPSIPTIDAAPSDSAIALPCVVCRRSNRAAAERCKQCHAPLELTRAAAARRGRTELLAVLGGAGAGKTCYLGILLDLLCRRAGRHKAEPLGAVSLALAERATAALASGVFPEPTPAAARQWDWSALAVRGGRRQRPLELVLADPSGGAWARQADAPGADAALAALLEHAQAAMLLVDADRLQSGDHAEEFLLMKLLAQFAPDSRRRRKPLALVLTKADASPGCEDDPLGFVRSHAGALLSACEARRRETRVFAAAVVGAAAPRRHAGTHRMAPLRVEPRGVVQPLGWIAERLP